MLYTASGSDTDTDRLIVIESVLLIQLVQWIYSLRTVCPGEFTTQCSVMMTGPQSGYQTLH